MALLAARPWYKALEDLAQTGTGKSPPGKDWLSALEALASLVRNSRVLSNLITLEESKARELLLKLAGEFLWDLPVAFALELKKRRLLNLLKDFPQLWKEGEETRTGSKEVILRLPYALTDGELTTLCEYLEKKFHCRLQPRVEIDPNLVGGYIARVGDKIWDATVHGSLDRLKDHILWDREIENAT